jgi:predicted nucleotidyltransferase
MESGKLDINVSYQRVLNNLNMIMLAPAGSELLGLHSEKSDRDEMGICLETPKNLLGFSNFEQQLYRSAEERTGITNTPSGDGDIDLVVYGLRKFTRLALGGNPNIIGMLFIPSKTCTIYTDIAAELQGMRELFISKSVGKAFLGYMRAQRERLTGDRGQRDVNRQALIEKFGYDTKYAMHMLRLGWQCYKLLHEKALPFPIPDGAADYFKCVRNGEYSLERILRDATDYEEKILEQLVENNTLPKYGDTASIEDWLIKTYERAWYENKTTSQQHRIAPDTQRQNAGASPRDSEESGSEIPFL